MTRPTRFVRAAGALACLAALASAQSGVVAWGWLTFDGRDNGRAFVEISAGQHHTVARRSDGSIAAWGFNRQLQCIVPALPSGLSYTAVEAGGDHVGSHTAALRSDGALVAWGFNTSGQCNVPPLPP